MLRGIALSSPVSACGRHGCVPRAAALIWSRRLASSVALNLIHADQTTVLYIAMHRIAGIVAALRCLTVINMARRPRFDPDSLVPLYVQAADYVAAQITAAS